MKTIAWIALLVTLSGCASYRPGMSDAAQTADSLTTAIGVHAMGKKEANPVLKGVVNTPEGMVALAAFKVYLTHWARQQDYVGCRQAVSIFTGMGAGAALSNAAVLAGWVSTAIIALPASVAFGMWSYRTNAVKECEHQLPED